MANLLYNNLNIGYNIGNINELRDEFNSRYVNAHLCIDNNQDMNLDYIDDDIRLRGFSRGTKSGKLD